MKDAPLTRSLSTDTKARALSLSDIAEIFFQNNWITPALPADMLADQFAFRPTGCTTCALIHFMHHVSLFIETNSYVSLMYRELPPVIVNWVISFLTDLNQMCKLAA